MKAVITADTHLDINNFINEDGLRGCEEIAKVVQKEKAIFIHAGDVFTRPRPAPEQYQFFARCLGMIKAERNYIIGGNHDNTALMHNLNAYDSGLIKGNYLFWVGFQRIVIEGFNLILAPFQVCEDFGDATHEFASKHIDSNRKNILITHLDIPGSTFGSEREVQMGDVGSLPVVKGLDYIISGHIHKHQAGTYGKVPYVYPGSLSRISHSEEKEPKGFLLFDFETLTFEFIKRKTDLKWFTVNVDWKGKLPSITRKGDIARVNIKATGKYRGQIDRNRIQKDVLDKYSNVSVNIEYTKKISKEARQIAKGVSFDAYEQAWIDDNITDNKTAVKAKIKKVLRDIPVSGAVNKELKGLYIHSYKLTNYQALLKIDKKFGKNDCVGILGEVNGERTQSNGTGKSSFVEGLRWILHGATRFSKNTSIITDYQDVTTGEVVFKSAKKDVIKIARELGKKGSKSFVYINDALAAKGAKVAEWVNANFGGNLKVFDYLVYLGSLSKSLIGGKPSERLRALQEPLPLDRYTNDALKVIKKEKSDTTKLVHSFKGVMDEFSELEGRKDSIETYRKVLFDLEDDEILKKESVSKIRKEIKKFNDIKGKLFARHYLKKDIDDAEGEIKKHKGDLKELGKVEDLKQIKELGDTRSATLKNAGLKEQNILKDVHKYENSIENVNESIALLKAGICVKCGSNVSADHIKKMKSKYFADRLCLNETLKEFKQDLKKIQDQIGVFDQELTNCREKYFYAREHNGAIEVAEEKLSEYSADLKSAKTKLGKLPKITEAFNNITIEKEIRKQEGLLSKAEDILDDIREEKSSLTLEINQFDIDWTRYQSSKISYDKHKKELQVLNFCYDAFSPKGIPNFIISKIIEETNNVIPTVISEFKFWNCSDVFLESNSDSIGVWTVINGKPQREYEGLSSGEREVSNYIVVESYKRVLQNLIDMNYNFVLIDESLDNLDFANVSGATQYYKNQKIQAFCISHRDLKDQFTKTAIVKSDGNLAEVV